MSVSLVVDIENGGNEKEQRVGSHGFETSRAYRKLLN